MAQTIWILIALLSPKLWRDPHSDAHRWLPLDREGRAWMERLASTPAGVVGSHDAEEAAAPASSDSGAPNRRAGRRSIARDSLEWFAGAGATADRQLLEAWERILRQAEDLMWDQRDATVY